MRFAPVILALPALAVAQQVPFLDQAKSIFDKATQAASAYIPSSSSRANPVDAGAAKVADLLVDQLTLENHKTLLQPGSATASPGIEEWMIYVTGGNKTCFGLCARADKEWNKAVPVLKASTGSPYLAQINCDDDPVLCNAWALGPPAILHFQLPQPLADQSLPATTVRSLQLNRTSVSAAEIAAVHTEEKYKTLEPYTGVWHPFDGLFAKFGLGIPFGYVLYYFSIIPSWMFMIGISFFSRSFM